MLRTTIFACVVCLSVSVAQAQQKGSATETWHCVNTADELFDLTIQNGQFRANNFSISEGTTMMSGNAPVIKFSASASNRSSSTMAVSIEITGMSKVEDPEGSTDDKSVFYPIFSLSAQPGMGIIAASSNEDISTSILTETGYLALAEMICVRVSMVTR